MPRTPAVLALAIVLLAPTTNAQIANVPPGAHVRVHAPTIAARPFEATVLGRFDDTLAVQLDDRPPLRIWMARIRVLEVGRPSRAAGALRGAGFGFPVGLGIAYYGVTSRHCDEFTCTHGQFGPAVGTTALAMGAGAVIGALIGGEKWDSLDLLPHASSLVVPASGGLGVRLAF
jgi:hypothetical protein